MDSTLPDEALERLLAPISVDRPCGDSIRFDTTFTAIRLEREEEDARLPMGVWERPLKRADWALIEDRCKTLLTERSKDLQVAAWLTEAWVRRYEMAGLERGLWLICALLDRYWSELHPVIDADGDGDARCAPLEWINESLSLTIKVHVSLVRLDDRVPPRVTLADWELMTHAELSGASDEDRGKVPTGQDQPLSRALVIDGARHESLQQVIALRGSTGHCIGQVERLSALLTQRMGSDAPSLSRLSGILQTVDRVLGQLLPESPAATPAPGTPPIPELDEMIDLPDSDPSAPESAAQAKTATSPGSPRRTGWASRDEAYRTLEALAEYLSAIEPHSPTPYLIRRAVRWGRMPLPALMAEIVREEGDLNRLMSLLSSGQQDDD